MSLRSIYLVMGLSLFAGCAKVPDKDLAQIVDMPSLQISEKEALKNSYFQAGNWPSEKWWEMFDDPQLNDLIELALLSNFTLREAQARVEYSRQLAKKVRANLFPTLSLDYTEQWQYLSKYGFDRDFFPLPPGVDVPHTLNLIDLGLSFSYEFDFWGKNRDLFRSALSQAQADIAEERQAQLVITTSIAERYFALQTKLTQKEILEERLDQRMHLFDLTDARNEKGLVNAIPTFQSDKEIHMVQQSIVFLEEGIALDKHMLKYLLGLGPDHVILETVPKARFNKPFPLPENISSDLLARRPDLVAQIWRVEAAAKDIGAAKADFYPSVNLSAYGGLESISFGNLFRDSKTGGLFPAIHLPIFTGGSLRANLRSKVSAFNQAVFAYNDLILLSAKEVADQIVTVQASIEGFLEQLDAFDDTVAQYELLFSRYDVGLDNFLSVLDSEEDVLQQRFALAKLYLDHMLSVLNLIKKLGGGYHS